MAIKIRGLAPLLQVFDMQESIRFYRDVVGFEVVSTSEPGEHFDWALLRLNGVELMLNTAYERDRRPLAPDPARVAAHAGLGLYFGCQDLEETYAELCAKGVDVKPPVVREYGMKQGATVKCQKDVAGKSICRRAMFALPLAVFFSQSAAGGQLSLSMRLSFAGIGPIRVGMTDGQVHEVLGGLVEADVPEDNRECYYLRPAIKGLGFMMLDSRLARIDVWEGKWLSLSGAGIGTSEAEVRRLYRGRLKVERHHYADGHYMSVRPRDVRLRDYELLFETDGGIVTNFRAGLGDAVALVEGCS